MELTFQYTNNKTNKTMQFKDYPAEEICKNTNSYIQRYESRGKLRVR